MNVNLYAELTKFSKILLCSLFKAFSFLHIPEFKSCITINILRNLERNQGGLRKKKFRKECSFWAIKSNLQRLCLFRKKKVSQVGNKEEIWNFAIKGKDLNYSFSFQKWRLIQNSFKRRENIRRGGKEGFKKHSEL